MTIHSMDWTLQKFNSVPEKELTGPLSNCCGSSQWIQDMMACRPFKNKKQLLQAAREIWDRLPPSSWLEAFAHHPQIGDLDSLRKKFASTSHWAEQEQSGTGAADEQTLKALAAGNRQYLQKFGYIFIICATGKSATQMLDALNKRISNNLDDEIRIAAREQAEITHLRLNKLLI